MVKIAIILTLAHIVYYIYRLYLYKLFQMGKITNTPNKVVFDLRSKYNVKINTYKSSHVHLGYSLFGTVYLNERLLNSRNKSYKALKHVFYHEYYHLKHHAVKVLIMRIVLSFIPLLLLLPLPGNQVKLITLVTYLLFAAFIGYMTNKVFENQAEKYANSQDEKRNDN